MITLKITIKFKDFLHEYERLGQITEVNDDDNKSDHYFMPHHGIFKEYSSTTKLRMVFVNYNKLCGFPIKINHSKRFSLIR